MRSERRQVQMRNQTMNVPVYNIRGQQVGTMTIDEQALGGTINAALIKQAYVRYHANLRQGSARTRNRHEVEGSTRKLYRQKGTGRARHGDRKANLFRGGGHAHSKKRTREHYRLDMPVKMRRKANRNALLAKLVDNEVRVIDDLRLAEPRTREFVAFLEAVGINRSVLVALPADPHQAQVMQRAGRNVPDVSLCRYDQLTCFNMLNHRFLVIGRGELEAWLNGPWSQVTRSAKTDPLGRGVETVEAS